MLFRIIGYDGAAYRSQLLDEIAELLELPMEEVKRLISEHK